MTNKSHLENISFMGGYNLETISCPLCGGNDFKKIVVEQMIPVVRCLGCQLVFANPRPNREGLAKFYEDYFPPESAELWQKQMAEIFLIEGLGKITDYQTEGRIALSKTPKLLDVGCGMGFFLELMRKAGWGVQGIEPAPEAVKHARETLKMDVYQGVIESWYLDEPVFDVVTLWYVLEHVPNPGEILKRVHQLLKPGGMLIIRIPNQNAPIDQWLARLGLGKYFLMNPPRHLFDYSPGTITKFLHRSGFAVTEIRNGIPRKTGTWMELLRRHLWYGIFEWIYRLSGGKIIRGSSITVYALKKA